MKHRSGFVPRLFEFSSILYLALPLILFCVGWTKWYVATALICIIGFLLYRYWFHIREPATDIFLQYKKLPFIICGAVITIWVLLSGTGGLGTQTNDYNKHNAVISDLVTHPWPVKYEVNGTAQPLIYYVAYYLPGSAVGKVFHSVQIANVAILLWTLLGMLIVTYWLIRLVGKPSIFIILIFVLFSGMDILGQVVVRSTENTIPLLSIGGPIEWYSNLGNLEYSSNTTLLNWVPQHAIPAWIVGAMLAAAVIERRKKYPIVFLFALSILWSPFVSIGLIPLIAAYLYQNRTAIKDQFTVENILSAALCLVVGIYFLSGSASQPGGTFLDFSYPGWTWFQKLVVVLVFILFEFGILALLLRRSVLKDETKEWKLLFVCTLVLLTLLPFFRYGLYNDLVMRASISSLFILFVLSARYLIRHANMSLKGRPLYTVMGVVALLSIGSITAVAEFNVHTRGNHREFNDWQSIGNADLTGEEQALASQYLGNDNSLFFKKLAQ